MLERLDECETVYFQKLVDDYCKVEYVSLVDARLAIRELIQKIRDDLLEMSVIMREIDDRHVMYRSRAVQRAQFLLLSDGSIKGKINQLLKYYSLTIQNSGDIMDIDDSIVSACFSLTPQKAYGERYLATPTSSQGTIPYYTDDRGAPTVRGRNTAGAGKAACLCARCRYHRKRKPICRPRLAKPGRRSGLEIGGRNSGGVCQDHRTSYLFTLT